MSGRGAHRFVVTAAVLSALLLAAGACQPATSSPPETAASRAGEMPSLSPVVLGEDERLRVVATTSIVADVVRNVGGDLIDLTMLMPLGADPHAFEPTPQDATAVADAHVVFVNGAGLEVFLERLIASAGEGVAVVPVSYGVEFLQLEEAHGRSEEGDHDDSGVDPHTWFDPNNVIVWTRNVAQALSALDPANAEVYAANAQAYEGALGELDVWIDEQLARVPEANRRLVTDHTGFSYFARRYGFEQIGAVFPGSSTLAEPSAQDLAALEDAIRAAGVKAIFVGLTVNPDLAQRVADDTGTELVFLYTGSLSEAGGPADDYLAYMRYNVTVIAEALR